MKKSRNSRVSWPPDDNLCQVTLFCGEDCPSKMSCRPQNRNQQKPSSMKSFDKIRYPDLPPGFESNNFAANQKPPKIPRIKWKCPPRFVISRSWLVAAGEESTERQTQNLREAKGLEAVYPHRSAIPSRPSVSPDVEAEQYDDSKTAVVRLTPIEEEEVKNASSNIALQENDPTKPTQTQAISKVLSISKTPVDGKPLSGMISSLGADRSLAASAVLTALVKSKEHEGMIDANLLFKILKDPKMVENLIEGQKPKPPEKEISPSDTKIAPVIVSKPLSTSISIPCPNPNSIAVTPTFVVRNSYPLPMNSATSKPHPFFAFESKIEEPAVPKPRSEPMKATSPGFENGILNSMSKPVQPGSTVVLPRFKPLQMAQPIYSTLPMNVKPVEISAEPKWVQAPQLSFPPLRMNLNPIKVSTEPKLVQMSKPGFDSLPTNVNPVMVSSGPKSNPQVKDLDYFKNLIREHGAVKPETHENNPFLPLIGHHHDGLGQNINVAQNVKLVEGKAKIQKQCMHFQGSGGSPLDANYMCLHDQSNQWRAAGQWGGPRSKRMKF